MLPCAVSLCYNIVGAVSVSYNLSFNLAFRGHVQLGVEGRDRAFGRRARSSGRPARLAGVSQCRWRVSAPAGRSSPDPARRRGGRAWCGGEFAHAPAADQLRERARHAAPRVPARRLNCELGYIGVVGIHIQAYSCNRVLYWRIIESLHKISFVLKSLL